MQLGLMSTIYYEKVIKISDMLNHKRGIPLHLSVCGREKTYR